VLPARIRVLAKPSRQLEGTVVTIRIQIDPTRCEGFANCVNAAPDLFELDADGHVGLKKEAVEDDRAEAVRRAVYDCPVNVISFTQD
jgi:ferredoxin